MYSNARGIRSKVHSLNSVLDTEKPDVLAIVESQLAGNYNLRIDGYSRQVKRNRSKKGGGILVSTRDSSDLEMILISNNESHEQICVEISSKNEKFRLCVAYGLQESRSSEDDIDDWYYNLEKTVAENEEKPLLIVGDLNAHIGNDDEGIHYNTSHINSNGRSLREMVQRRNLEIINGTDRCDGKWTRIDPSGDKSIIDYIIANDQMSEKVINMKIDEDGQHTLTRYRKLNGDTKEIPTDHYTILTKVNIMKTYRKPEKIVKWNISSKEGLAKFNTLTTNVQMKEKWEDDGEHVDIKYNRWTKQIRSLMYQSFKRITVKDQHKSSKVKNMIKDKKKVRREIKHLNKQGVGNGIVASHMRLKLGNIIDAIATEIEEERAAIIKRRMEKMTQSKTMKSHEVWKIRRNLTSNSDPKMSILDKEGELITDSSSIKERYIEYYQELIKPRPPENEAIQTINQAHQKFDINQQLISYDHDEINEPFSERELEVAMKKLKDNKSPGHDGLTNELLKAGGTSMRRSLHNMINWMWKHEQIPSSLKDLDIKSIYKGKGQTADLKNHRGVFIGNSILKLYETMIDSRSSRILEKEGFTEYQAGGRRRRGITDHLFIVRAIIDHSTYFQLLLILELLDLIKAFDKMQLKLVMNDMWTAGVRGRIWRNIYQINKEAKIHIKTPMGITEGIKIGETVKQGSVLASKMASLHTDGANRMFVNTGLGIQYGEIKINNLIFQDDIIKLENSVNKINQSNIIYNWFSKVNGMKFHETKSVWLSNSKQKLDITLDDKQLPRAKNAKYLGDILTPDGKVDETIRQRKSAITGMLAEISTIMDEMGECRIEAALQYYNGILCPKLLTNSETWSNISSQNHIELEKIQNQTLKRLLRLPNGTPSKALKAELGVLSVKHQIIQKKLLFLHKILLYPEDHITRQILMEQRSIPSPTWLSKLEEEVLPIGIEINLEEIKMKPKETWGKEIKNKIKINQEKELKEWKKTSKKYGEMKGEIKLKKYCQKLNSQDSIRILKLRIGMTEAKSNFRNMHTNIDCNKCGKIETAEHLINCNMKNTKENKNTMLNFDDKIKNIETTKISILKNISVLIKNSLKVRASQEASPPPPPR